MKKIAHCIHHTHWDPIWYFRPEEARVQFVYNMKELLRALDDNRVKDFLLDGQTAALDEYLRIHPEDRERVAKHVREKRLFVGPFHSHADCFISSGESLANNLRLGIESAKSLGRVFPIAYLPDTFGFPKDMPKILQGFGIGDFVITRGVGDEYGLKNDFLFRSDDGSEVLTHVMLSGYGYGTYAFKDGTLFSKEAKDYNKIDVESLMERLLERSALEGEFVFPLGFDQNPAIMDIEERIATYNDRSETYHFLLSTWVDYLAKVRQKAKDLKIHTDELFSTQYHRVHKSVFSARADIKALQDETERTLALEVQPLMTLLDTLGLSYDQKLLDHAWETLVKCQTHASATLSDESNAFVLEMSLSALTLAESLRAHLLQIIALSVEEGEGMPLVVFHPLPYVKDRVMRLVVHTKGKHFILKDKGEEIPYDIMNQKRIYGGVQRKKESLREKDKDYHESLVSVELKDFPGTAYKVLRVVEKKAEGFPPVVDAGQAIENDHYRLQLDGDGLHLTDKRLLKTWRRFFHLEDSGDAGDTYDHSPPESDMIVRDFFEGVRVKKAHTGRFESQLTLSGNMVIPKGLPGRAKKRSDTRMSYKLTFRLPKSSPIIEVEGEVDNQAENHRLRFVARSKLKNDHSYAGTQFGFIKRATKPATLAKWKEKGFFEEPTPTWPLLNFVAAKGKDHTLAAFTKSVKEYEFVNEDESDIALTLFRAVGHLGLPDLLRRPGRPSGLDYKIIKTPESQMKGKNTFQVAFALYEVFDANVLFKDYLAYATKGASFQKQPFDKAYERTGYFPSNPLSSTLPESYRLLTLRDSDLVFSTLQMTKDKRPLLRLFNPSREKTRKGSFDTPAWHTPRSFDFLGENPIDIPDEKVLGPGRILNLCFHRE